MRRRPLWIGAVAVTAMIGIVGGPRATEYKSSAGKDDADAGAKATEQWEPVPFVVSPGAADSAPPSDAIVLFDGRNLEQWVSSNDHSPARWRVAGGVVTVEKSAGNIETRQSFRNYQLHLEWRIPGNVTGEGQARGNSGVFLAGVPAELQAARAAGRSPGRGVLGIAPCERARASMLVSSALGPC